LRTGAEATNVNHETGKRHSVERKALGCRTIQRLFSWQLQRKETSMIFAIASVMIVMCSFSGLVVCGLAKAAGKRTTEPRKSAARQVHRRSNSA